MATVEKIKDTKSEDLTLNGGTQRQNSRKPQCSMVKSWCSSPWC